MLSKEVCKRKADMMHFSDSNIPTVVSVKCIEKVKIKKLECSPLLSSDYGHTVLHKFLF